MPSEIPLETRVPTSPIATHRRASLKILSRNIDKVVLGNLQFPSWYYSPYPDSIIHGLDQAHNSNTGSVSVGGQTAIEVENSQSLAGGIKHERKQASTSSTTHTNGILKQRPSSSAGTADHAGNHHSSLSGDKGIVDTLHVCPYCFRYTPSATAYAVHVTLHLKKETEYYSSLKSPFSSPESQRQKARSTRRTKKVKSNRNASHDMEENEEESGDEGAPRPVPDTAVKVYSYGGYTVWDIDGEVEKQYCQNLSLFGKLFLEQKSVFFDTAGFHYFVLTYCAENRKQEIKEEKDSPSAMRNKVMQESQEETDGCKRGKKSPRTAATQSRASSSPTSTRRRAAGGIHRSTSTAEDHNNNQHHPNQADLSPQQQKQPPTLNHPHWPLQHQVLGFFSKENLSWDSNNLACILVFPPYQHRNLGQLLMSISYKLSGWEWEDSIIGGPEKPLSAMGRKSYTRFWSERIVRFVLGQSADAEGLKIFEEQVWDVDEDGDAIVVGKRRKKNNKTNKTTKKGTGKGKGRNKRNADDDGSSFNVRNWVKDELSVKELGDRTGMLAEDVVAALVEMGVCDVVLTKEDVNTAAVVAAATTTGDTSGTASGTAATTKRKRSKDDADGVDTTNMTIAPNATSTATVVAVGASTDLVKGMNTNMNMGMGMGMGTSGEEGDRHHTTTMTVQRSQVLDWARRHKIDLVSAVKEEGFLGEWALSSDDDDDDDDDEVRNEDGGSDENESEADADEEGSQDEVDSD